MTERPKGAKEFQRLLQRHAADIGQLPQRVMHLVRVGVVCAMLDLVRHDDGTHLFILKGGTAMQLRLGIHARATTDLDVVFRGRVEDWLDRFDAASADRTWNGFTVTRKTEPVPIEIPGLGYRTWRVPLQIRYEGREFGSTALEVAIDETSATHHELIEPAGIELAAFAIDPPRLVPCLDVPYQIAQKLHACTKLLPGGNDRVRDLIDIWLLEALLDPADLIVVRSAPSTTSPASSSGSTRNRPRPDSFVGMPGVRGWPYRSELLGLLRRLGDAGLNIATSDDRKITSVHRAIRENSQRCN